MKFVHLVLLGVLVATPVHAQYSTSNPMPRYGEVDKDKSYSDIEAEKKADRDYKRSIGNIPSAKQSDPWGGVRDDSASKPAAKAAAAKPAKPKAPVAQ